MVALVAPVPQQRAGVHACASKAGTRPTQMAVKWPSCAVPERCVAIAVPCCTTGRCTGRSNSVLQAARRDLRVHLRPVNKGCALRVRLAGGRSGARGTSEEAADEIQEQAQFIDDVRGAEAEEVLGRAHADLGRAAAGKVLRRG